MNRKSRRAETGNKSLRPGALPGIGDLFADAVLHHRAGRLNEAEQLYRQILQHDPRHIDALHLLGVLAHQLGRNDVAVELIGKAIAENSQIPAFHSNLGLALKDQGKLEEAVLSYRRALAHKPDLAETHSNLGVALKDQGKLEEAVLSYRRSLAHKPDYAEAQGNMGVALKNQGKLEEAVVAFGRALAHKPDYAEAHGNLGLALMAQDKLEVALASFRRALVYKPAYAEAHSNLGHLLLEQGKLEEATLFLDQALAQKPDYAEAHNNLGRSLMEQGKLEGAVASYRQALKYKPGFADAHSNLLFGLAHDERVTVEGLFAEHCRFAQQFETSLRDSWPEHCNGRDPDRILRVGFVSGDLRFHAVANFIEPVLALLATSRHLSLYGYYNHTMEDPVTERIRHVMAHWRSVAGLTDAALAHMIREDGIDILIDLSGHTAKNRLTLFARKPAPLQASWVGYPGTTGLRAMDYYLTDRYFLPPGRFDTQFTEKLLHLPVSVSFLPYKEAPPVNDLPALRNGTLTFGSFNRISKLNHSVIALWSQLLRALPQARMMLGAMPETGRPERLIGWFAQEGIGPERLSFFPRCGMPDYLGQHHHIDFCLDSFPYSGDTTTNHALWMGVPTLTLAGGTAPGREGAAKLAHVGLEDFIARDKADFLEKGLFWANNLPLLAALRAGLRERFQTSPLCRAETVADGLERGLRMMWQLWCRGYPPETFEVPPSEYELCRASE